jgi:predicted RNA binding protein YcfA (HicA-like mRNA interferase family)
VRQKGSYIRLRKITIFGEHNITVADHKVVAKGTLNDIITKISLSKDDLIKMM